MTFDELILNRKFRQILSRNGFNPANHVQLSRAKEYWEKRYPSIEWGLCPIDGCNEIVKKGEYCKIHRSNSIPTWQWQNGTLYRYVSFRFGHAGEFGGKEYRPYIRYLTEKKFGKIPAGYQPTTIDGNPFNLTRDNIVVLSHVSVDAIKAGHLSVPLALRIDERIADIISRTGARPRTLATYGFSDIAKAASLSEGAVRSAAHRGTLDMNDLGSVADFVAKHHSESRVETTDSPQIAARDRRAKDQYVFSDIDELFRFISSRRWKIMTPAKGEIE